MRIKTSIALIAAGAFSASAVAFDTVDHSDSSKLWSDGNGVTLSWAPVGDPNPFGPRNDVKFSSMPGSAGLTGFFPGTTHFNEDYTTYDNADFALKIFRFTGGVGAALDVVWFDFYDETSTYYNYFGVQLPYVGVYNWTITITNPFNVTAGGFVDGYADSLYVVTTSTFNWYGTNLGASVGSTDPNYGFLSSYGYDLSFEMETPTPGALALLGLAGLATRRRRR